MRAGIYARISSDREGEALGVGRQLDDCRKLVADRGWEVADEYVDNDISATDPRKKRKEYERLLRDIEQGRIDAVAVWAEDRLHRRPIELEEFAAACGRAGVTQLVTVSGTVDLGTGDGMLVARIKGAVAVEESRKIGQRIRRKLLENAEHGLPHGGTRAFGYEKNGMAIRETEAAMVRDAADKILHGATLWSIRAEWQASGVQPVREGERWSTKSVRNALIRPRTAGLRQHQGAVVGDAAWPAILDRETWDRVRAVLSNPSRRTNGRNGTAEGRYPLKGVLVCGVCGHQLTSMPRTEKGKEPTRFYGCRKQLGGGRCGEICVTNKAVEGYLLPIIRNIADSPSTVEWANAQDEVAANEVRGIVEENATDEQRLAMLGDMVADGAMTRSEYTRQSARLRRRVEQRQARMAAVRSASVLNGSVNADWDSMTAEQQCQVVASIVREVRVAKLARHSSRFQPSRLTVFWAIESLAQMTGNEDDPAWLAEIAADRELSRVAVQRTP